MNACPDLKVETLPHVQSHHPEAYNEEKDVESQSCGVDSNQMLMIGIRTFGL